MKERAPIGPMTCILGVCHHAKQPLFSSRLRPRRGDERRGWDGVEAQCLHVRPASTLLERSLAHRRSSRRNLLSRSLAREAATHGWKRAQRDAEADQNFRAKHVRALRHSKACLSRRNGKARTDKRAAPALQTFSVAHTSRAGAERRRNPRKLSEHHPSDATRSSC